LAYSFGGRKCKCVALDLVRAFVLQHGNAENLHIRPNEYASSGLSSLCKAVVRDPPPDLINPTMFPKLHLQIPSISEFGNYILSS
jgi:hypothetical protein